MRNVALVIAVLGTFVNASAQRPAPADGLESGVTTVRSAGVSNYADVGFHELVKKGAVAGPDVVTAGYHVRPQLAAEAFLSDPPYSDLMAGVTTIDRMRRAVQMNLSHGVNWIKILATERAGTAETDPRKQVYTEGASSTGPTCRMPRFRR